MLGQPSPGTWGACVSGKMRPVVLPYPVRQGPPGGHTPAEVTEDPEHNHARLQAAGASLWRKK